MLRAARRHVADRTSTGCGARGPGPARATAYMAPDRVTRRGDTRSISPGKPAPAGQAVGAPPQAMRRNRSAVWSTSEARRGRSRATRAGTRVACGLRTSPAFAGKPGRKHDGAETGGPIGRLARVERARLRGESHTAAAQREADAGHVSGCHTDTTSVLLLTGKRPQSTTPEKKGHREQSFTQRECKSINRIESHVRGAVRELLAAAGSRDHSRRFVASRALE
jgi:hypothetical protein